MPTAFQQASPESAEGSQDDFVKFAHGTNRSGGQQILAMGVNETASVAAMAGSREPGSFFTVEINPFNPLVALETAAFWDGRHGKDVCIVLCCLPSTVVRALEQLSPPALIHEVKPTQSIFRPRSFGIINQYLHYWYQIDLTRE